MSESVVEQGVLTPIDRDGLSIDQWIQSQFDLEELPEEYEDWIEYLGEASHKPGAPPRYYVSISRDEIYEISNHRKSHEPDFANAERRPDGSIAFFVGYYNGGASLDEVIDEALEGLSG